MGKNIFMAIGLVMLLIGIIGFLFLLNGKPIGYVISNTFLKSDKSSDKSIELSEIEEIIARAGSKKTFSLNVKNNDNNLLTRCILRAEGEIKSWIYSSQIENISPKENIDFTFNINIPEEIEIKNYKGELELDCKEKSISQPLTIYIVKGLKAIELKSINEKNKILNINYTFDNSDFIGDSVFVTLWIENSGGIEVERIIDIFFINKDRLIERKVLIDLRDQQPGIYKVYFALSSDLDDYLKKSIILGESSLTGKVVFKVVKGKGLPYLIFLLIIGIGVFFIFKSHRRSVQKMHEKKGLLKKKTNTKP